MGAAIETAVHAIGSWYGSHQVVQPLRVVWLVRLSYKQVGSHKIEDFVETVVPQQPGDQRARVEEAKTHARVQTLVVLGHEDREADRIDVVEL